MSSSKGSVFDDADGRFLIYGNSKSQKIEDLVASGDIWAEGVNGGGPNYLMWNGTQAVPDDARIAEENQAEADKEAMKEAKKDSATDFETLVASLPNWSKDDIQQAMEYLVIITK